MLFSALLFKTPLWINPLTSFLNGSRSSRFWDTFFFFSSPLSDDNPQLQINSSSQHPSATSPIFLPLLQFSLFSLSLLLLIFLLNVRVSPCSYLRNPHICAHPHRDKKKEFLNASFSSYVTVDEETIGQNGGIRLHPDPQATGGCISICAHVQMHLKKALNMQVYGMHF